jgi:pimeloyl-ACP methyl ester carboxylesterase
MQCPGSRVEPQSRYLPDAHRVTIPGARHAMNLAAPGVFNSAVLDFLD